MTDQVESLDVGFQDGVSAGAKKATDAVTSLGNAFTTTEAKAERAGKGTKKATDEAAAGAAAAGKAIADYAATVERADERVKRHARTAEQLANQFDRTKREAAAVARAIAPYQRALDDLEASSAKVAEKEELRATITAKMEAAAEKARAAVARYFKDVEAGAAAANAAAGGLSAGMAAATASAGSWTGALGKVYETAGSMSDGLNRAARALRDLNTSFDAGHSSFAEWAAGAKGLEASLRGVSAAQKAINDSVGLSRQTANTATIGPTRYATTGRGSSGTGTITFGDDGSAQRLDDITAAFAAADAELDAYRVSLGLTDVAQQKYEAGLAKLQATIRRAGVEEAEATRLLNAYAAAHDPAARSAGQATKAAEATASEWQAILVQEEFAARERIAQTKTNVAANWEAQLAMDEWGAREAKAKLATEWEGLLALEGFQQRERIAQTKAQVASAWEAQMAMDQWGAREAKAKLATEWEASLAMEQFDAPVTYRKTVASFDKEAGDALKYTEALDRLRTTAAAAGVSLEQLAADEAKLAASLSPAAIAAKKEEEALQRLVGTLDRTFGAEEKLIAQQRMLDKAMTDGVGGIKLTAEQHAALSAKLKEQHDLSTRAATSTKLAAHESLNLGYQLQDFVVQVGSGQSAIVAMLQQAPQAVGAVGGMSRAWALLVSPVTLAALGIGSVGAALALVGARAVQINSQIRELTATTRAYGTETQATAEQLQGLSTALYEGGAARGESFATAKVLASTRGISAGMGRELALLGSDMTAGLGGSVDDMTKQLAAMVTDGYPAIQKLHEAIGFLTPAEVDAIRVMAEHGRQSEALGVALGALHRRFDGLRKDAMSPAAEAMHELGVQFNRMVDAAATSSLVIKVEIALSEKFKLLADFLEYPSKDTFARLAASTLTTMLPGSSKIEYDAPKQPKDDEVRKTLQWQLDAARARVQDLESRSWLGGPHGGYKASFQGPLETARAEVSRLEDRLTAISAKASSLAAAATSGPPAHRAANDLSPADIAWSEQNAKATEYVKEQTHEVDRLSASLRGNAVDRALATAAMRAQDEIRDKHLEGIPAENLLLLRQREALLQLQVAVNDNNRAAAAEVAGADLVARAYGQSTAAVREAEIQAKALAEVARGTIEPYDAIVGRLRALDDAQRKVQASQFNAALKQQTEDAQRLAAAWGQGANAAREAALANEALTEARKRGLDPSRDAGQIKEISTGILARDVAQRSQQFAQMATEQRRAVDLANAEFGMLGQSNAERARSVAIIQATNNLRDKGVDLTDAGTQAYIRQAGELARVNSQLQDTAQNAANIAQPITTAFEDVIVGAKKAGDAGKALAEDLKRVFARVLVTKPAETWLTGTLTKLMSGGVAMANDNTPRPANDPASLSRIVNSVSGGLGSSESNAMWVQMAGSAAAVALDPRAMTGSSPMPVAIKDGGQVVDMLRSEARAQGVPEDVVLAVAKIESNFRQYRDDGRVLTSSAGAQGVMQLMPDTAKWLGVDATDTRQNIQGGVKFLSMLGRQFGGDWNLVAGAYNAGPGRMTEYLRDGRALPAEAVGYMRNFGSTVKSVGTDIAALGTRVDGVTAAQERALQAQLDTVEVQRSATDSTQQTLTATQQSWVNSALGLTSVTKDASSVIEVKSRAISHVGENAIGAADGLTQARDSATKFATEVADGADTFLGGVSKMLGGASDWLSELFGGSSTQQKVIKNADGSTSFAPAAKGAGGSWLSSPVFPEDNAQRLFDAGQSGSWQNGKWSNTSPGGITWGQVLQGIGGIASGAMLATQKGASAGQKIGGGLTAAGGVVSMIPGGQTAGGVMMAAGALLSAVTGAKDRGEKYSISHITLGANGRYALGAYAQDNDGDPTRFNADASKVAKGLNDIIARLNLTPTGKDSYIDSKNKSAEQAALELLKGMKSGVPEISHAIAHESAVSLEDMLSHLEFANGFDPQIKALRNSLSDLFSQFQTGVEAGNSLGRTLLDIVDNAGTVFSVSAGAKLPGFARGTLSAPTGWAVVGEEGPEVVRLSGGERIWNARESAQMLAQMGQGRDDTLIHLRGGDELAAVRRVLGHPGTINPETGLLGFEYGGGDHGSPGSGGSAGSGGGSSGNSAGGSGSTSGGSGGGFGGVGTASEGPSISRTSSTPMSQGDMRSYGGYSFGSFSGADRSGTIGFGGAASYASPTSEQVAATAAAVDNVYGTSLSGWLTNAALKYGLNITKSIGVDPATGLNNTQLSVNAAGVVGDLASLATGIPGLGLAMGALADALDVDHITIGSIDANGNFSGAMGSASAASGVTARDGGEPDRYSTTVAAAETRAAAERDAAAAAEKAAAEAAAQKAAQRAALQTQFDAVGLSGDRVSELNDVVASLGANTFSPIGKDFDRLAADMRKAADAYVAAGQSVPDGLFGALKQMEALGAVKKRLLDEVAGTTIESSPEQQKVEQLKGKWSNTATDLVKAFASVGIVGDELAAKLQEGFNNGLKKEQKSYSDGLDTAYRKSKGEEGYDSAASLIDAYKTSVKDVNALWPEGADRAAQMAKVTGTLTNNMAGLVKSGSITSISLQQIITAFADTPDVVRAATAALQQLNEAAAEAERSFAAGVASRMQAALGNSRGAGLITLDEQQRQELKAAKEAGRDVTQLQQVQAAERAAQAFQLAQADVLGSYDRQISAQQELISSLQEGALKVTQVAKQFAAARDALAISEDAPISPQERLAEARRQWDVALATVRSSTASEDEQSTARSTLTSLSQTLVSLEKTNSAGTSRAIYDEVMRVLGELGTIAPDTSAATAEADLKVAQDSLKELQRSRAEAARVGERQYGAITGLKDVMDQSYAVWQAALGPLKTLTGTNDNSPHYSASAAVQTAWDGLSAAQQHGVARAMGWGGDIDSAFNMWLATDKTRASTFEANVTTIGGGARYAAPEDVGRAWEALTQAQQSAAVKAAGYDGGVDAGLNAWVRLGHASAFEAAVRSAAHGAGVPGFAAGTLSTPPGAVWVGERGPELLWQGGGAAIASSVDSMRIAGLYQTAANDRYPANVTPIRPTAGPVASDNREVVSVLRDIARRIERLEDAIHEAEGEAQTQRARIARDEVKLMRQQLDELQERQKRTA
ncbi:phage tail length tape measure family protein [Azospirillum sp. Sh1]|uniref:phage tail length tape measure family protein n=1 Tax=Azospirillum sp. Sh1 TaxID=2607285 RepID=UPI001B3C1208|nr:phage tail length tape measure family protein [Azospirillum sp. Sh1]